MDGKILDPDGARAHLAAWKGRIDKMAQETEAMRQRLQELRVTARDPNGLAEVSVDSTGTLVGLKLTDRIVQVTPDVVARTIMTTLGEARNRLADQSREVIEETVGKDSPAARAIAESVDHHLRRDLAGEDTEDDTAHEEPVQRNRERAGDVDDDDDAYDVINDLRR